MSAASRERVGDRVERAIEDRADVEQRDRARRGAARRPPQRCCSARSGWRSPRLAVPRLPRASSTSSARGATSTSSRRLAGARWPALQVRGARLPVGAAAPRHAGAAGPPVITSQLAGNALSKIAPGGGAVGRALQYRMLVDAGVRRAPPSPGLTAVNLLAFAAVLGAAGARACRRSSAAASTAAWSRRRSSAPSSSSRSSSSAPCCLAFDAPAALDRAHDPARAQPPAPHTPSR